MIRAALNLLERQAGPILEDFPDEAPALREESPGEIEGWTCPVNFGDGIAQIAFSDDPAGALAQELDQIRSWYDLAIATNGRTTVGISEVPLPTLTDFLLRFLADVDTNLPRTDLPRHQNVKLAIDEHKAFYFEASASKPGGPSDTEIADWFYGDSVMGQLLIKLNAVCADSGDKMLQKMSDRRIIPVRQRYLKGQVIRVPSPEG